MKTKNLKLINDVVFKAVYGRDTPECKEALISLLNLILDRKADPIVSLIYKNPFLVREYDEEKENILDIKVETDRGELIDVEIQIITQDHFINRTVFYHAGIIRESLKKGEPYDKIMKSITICIVNDVLFDETEKFLNIFEWRERTERVLLTDISALYYIELPKVNRRQQPIAGLSQLETYLEYMRLAEEMQDGYIRELIAHGGEELEMVQRMLEKATREDILREKALAREKWEHDMAQMESSRKNSYQWGKEDGLKRGREDGLKRGREDGMYILIAAYLEDGSPEEQILAKLKKQYSLTEVEAKRHISQYRADHKCKSD